MQLKNLSEKIHDKPRFISRMGLIVLILITGACGWLASEYFQSVKWRSHSQQVIAEINFLETSLYSSLAYHRGYFLVPDNDGLRRYVQAKEAVRGSLYQLSLLVKDNPEQMRRLDRLSGNILTRISVLESSLDALRQNSRRTGFLMLYEDIREAHNNETNYLISQLQQEEKRLLTNREERANDIFLRICILILGGLITAFMLFFSSTYLWEREVQSRYVTEKELQNTNKQIKKASDLKSNFLTNMSHEIRTPLNGITGMVKLLEHTSLNAHQLDYVETIKTSSAALLSLINDILDLSKIEAGKFQLEEINFELASLMKSTVSIVDYAAKTKKLKIRLEVDPDIPEFYLGDPLRLRQVLLNLLNNAIKFSDQGEVVIRVTHKILPNNNHRLNFEVSDQGIGFDHETKARLFQVFSQGDESTTRNYGGSGLGLYISRQIIEMMKGSIDAESIKGVGSKFFFEVPLKIAAYDSKSAPVVSIRDLSHQLHGNILIAEDNRINQKVISEMVSLLGCHFVMVKNGEEVLEALRKEKFDLIIMDGQMPVMDGYDTARAIRDGAAGAHNKFIPIIASSANALKGDIEKSLESGMNDYVSKPISYNDLASKIEKWLRQGSSIIDDHQLEKLRRQENLSGKILIPELVDMFIHDSEAGLRQMQNHLIHNNTKSLRSVAHNLKTSGAILGALRFKDIAERMERAPEDITDEQMANLLSALEREMNFAVDDLRRRRHGPLIEGPSGDASI